MGWVERFTSDPGSALTDNQITDTAKEIATNPKAAAETAVVVAATVYGGPAGGAAASAAITKLNGGSNEDALKAGAASYVGGEVGSYATDAGAGPVGGPMIGGAAGGALGAAAQGQDVGKGAVSGAVTSGISSGVSQGLAPSSQTDYLSQPAPAGTSMPSSIDQTGVYQIGSSSTGSQAGRATGFGYTPDASLNAPNVGGYTGYVTPDVSYSSSVAGESAPQISKTTNPQPSASDRAAGQLASQVLSPGIINLLYPSSTPSGPNLTATPIGGTSAALGQALASQSPDTSLTGEPILGGEGKTTKQVWNTESLRNALGIA